VSGSLRSLSIVIPAYNEAARIKQSLDELRDYLSTAPFAWELRVVDDGSSDDTRAIVAAVAAADRRVVLQSEPHLGKGGAVRAGMLAASSDHRFLCDADLSMPLAELPRFLAAVPNRVDIAIGSREGDGARRVGEPDHRHTMGRVFNWLVRTTVVPGLQDTQCGFKMFSAAAAANVFRRVRLPGWAFDIEVLHIARRLGYSVEVIPIEWHYREHSRVHPIRDSIAMARDVGRIRVNSWMGRYRI
jgi:glycosyltransferase involved in cell wall biosynthesis